MANHYNPGWNCLLR